MEILAPGTPYGGGAAAAFVTPDAVEDGDCCDLCATLPERQRNMRFRSHDHTPAWGSSKNARSGYTKFAIGS